MSESPLGLVYDLWINEQSTFMLLGPPNSANLNGHKII